MNWSSVAVGEGGIGMPDWVSVAGVRTMRVQPFRRFGFDLPQSCCEEVEARCACYNAVMVGVGRRPDDVDGMGGPPGAEGRRQSSCTSKLEEETQ